MRNARRIVLILVLITAFIFLAQQLDQIGGPPATPSPAGPGQEVPGPVSDTDTPEGYPLVAPTNTPAGPYPPPKPTPTPTPEGYEPPSS